MSNLLRNGSGYVDITAYKAINNLEGANQMEYKRGEIFEYELSTGALKEALVVSADYRAGNTYISILMLHDTPKGEMNIPVNCCGGIMYVDCGQVSYAHYSKMGNFLKRATDAEMAQIDDGICKCLGIEQKTIEVPVEKVVEVSDPTRHIDAFEIAEMVKKDAEELATARAEANVYKGLYERLLATMMGGVNNGGK